MQWLKKFMYKKGAGSAQQLAIVFTKSFKNYLDLGFSEFEASKKVFDEYISSFEMMGVNVNYSLKNSTVKDANGDPALVCFSLLIIGNSNNPDALYKIQEDNNLIVKLILEEQNKILGENRTIQSLEERHSDF